MEGEATQEPLTEIESAPRCPKCGYVLIGLTENRCPECGGTFDPAIVEQAGLQAALLPWERPEKWGVVLRLLRTFAQASFRPGRYFANVSQRRDHRIVGTGRLIFGLVILAACMHLLGDLLGDAIWGLQLLLRGASPSKALETITRTMGVGWKSGAMMSALQILIVLLSAVVMALLIGRLFRGRLTAIRTMDMAALLSPAVAFGALIYAIVSLVPRFIQDSVNETVNVYYYAQPLVLMLLVWFACRRLLVLSKLKSIGMVIVSGVAMYLISLVAGMFEFLIVNLVLA